MERQKLPIKFLLKHSLRLLLYFTLASSVIITLFEHDLRLILSRLAIGIIMFLSVFFINIGLLIFFEKKKKTPTDKTGRKIFFTGWFLVAILVTFFIFLTHYLRNQGLDLVPRDSNSIDLQTMPVPSIILYVLYTSLILNSFIFLIQNFLFHQFEKNRIEMELLQLQAINTKTKNQLLQQQIQPHFLFNALNILKSLIRKYPETAEAYLVRLSDFLRVSITGNKSGLATVQEELKLCEDYIEMQKIRFGNAICYEVQIEDKDECINYYLPFFSLQPLLENAIKHNELTKRNPLHLTINWSGEYITVQNNLQPKKSMETSTGHGLSNLQERYRLLSGDDVIIEERPDYFLVSLKLLKNESSNHRG